MTLLDLANPLQGTDSRYDFSTGNTYPAIGVPRGVTYWSPQTSDGGGFFFDRRVAKLAGFRATHCPSPWMSDYGHFDVMPVVGPIAHLPGDRASAYELISVRPDAYRVRLMRYGIDAALTATRTCGVMRFVFPAGSEETSIVIQTGTAGHTDGELVVRTENGRTRVFGRSKSNNGGVPEGFACHFLAEVRGAEVTGFGTLTAKASNEGSREVQGPRAGIWLKVRPTAEVTVRIGTSFISLDQAELNLHREVGDKSFDAITAETAALWEKWLGKVEVVSGTDIQRRTLYSCLYRVGLWPMAMHEFDAAGAPTYFSPYSGKVNAGVMYTNNGFWDTYRTVYPLLGLIDRDGFSEIVRGFLQAYRDGGWLPKWCSPGYRDCMIGSHSDAILAEAVMRDIGSFELKEAYEAIRHNAFEPVTGTGAYGRAALTEYDKLGYVPFGSADACVSWTLDNAHCDWCVAQVALKLGGSGPEADAKRLLERSQNYRKLWDPETRFFRPKLPDGTWARPFREFEWGHAYVEGGPWQHRFHVPHDPTGLANLLGGVDGLITELDRMFTLPPTFEAGSYGIEIHEMTEMAYAKDAKGHHFGQYAQSNQPVHGFLALPAALGRPDWTGPRVARVMDALYTPDVFPGDEDNGEMAAWYVLAAIGEMPACVGSGKTVSIKPWQSGSIQARIKA